MKKPFVSSLKPNSVWLTSEDFEYLCFDFAKQFLSFNEPIPDYFTRDSSLLESSLGSPQQTFGGKLLYPTLIKQASILFYSLIKNHPFQNGNKRLAVMSLLVFLSLNDKWLSIDPFKLYKLALNVAGGEAKGKEKVIKMIETEIKKYLISFPNI